MNGTDSIEPMLSAATRRPAEGTAQPRVFPEQKAFLVFRDPVLEGRYQQREYDDHRKVIGINVIVGLLLVLAFVPLDPWLVPADLVGTFLTVRLGVLSPLAVAAFIYLLFNRPASRWAPVIAVSMLVFGLSWTWLLIAGREHVLGYVTLALVQTVVGAYFLLGIPVRLSIPLVAAFSGAFIVVAFMLPIHFGAALTHVAGCVTVVLVAGFGAYRYERASRQQFVAQALSAADYAERLAAQADRNRWLEVFAAFLRHEMKNAMVGVSSSIEMARRVQPAGQAEEYLLRGTQSLAFMRRLLAQAADAASLQSALETQELEPVNLSELVAGCVEDRCTDSGGRRIESQVETGVWVSGHADRLVQMFDKLLDNALEHADSAQAPRVCLDTQSGDAVLTVTDHGEPLPADTASLFEAFVSGKPQSIQSGNLGLGLFVARAIAQRHQGTITATALADPAGARFTVRLPCCDGVQSTSQR
jgi:signal transduction histidine kinase